MAEELSEETLHINQSIIDMYAQRLVGLRTQCATSAELTQQEIRTLEGKIIKMFSRQLVAKATLRHRKTSGDLGKYASLEQWLQVVGLGTDSVKAVCVRVRTLEELQEKSERDLRPVLGARPEELDRLFRALHNLRKYTELVRGGEDGICKDDLSGSSIGGSCGEKSSNMSLYWDSWDRHRRGGHHSPRPSAVNSTAAGGGRQRPAYRASIPNEQHHHPPMGEAGGGGGAGDCSTPTPDVVVVPAVIGGEGATAASATVTPTLCNGSALVHHLPTYYAHAHAPASPVSPTFNSNATTSRKGLSNCRTPPACRKNTVTVPPTTPTDFPLTKSKSHESQLAADCAASRTPPPPPSPTVLTDDSSSSSSALTPAAAAAAAAGPVRRERLPTEPGPEYAAGYDVEGFALAGGAAGCYDSDESVGGAGGASAAGGGAAVAPPSPRVLRHRIAHRFQKTFKMMSACGVCQKPIYFGTGLRCRECKYRCHRDCEERAAPSCGLTTELLDAVKGQYSHAMFGSPGGGGGGAGPPGGGRKMSAPQPQLYQQMQQQGGYGGRGGEGYGPFYGGVRGGVDLRDYHHHQQVLPHSSSSTTSSCNSSAPSSPAPPPVVIMATTTTTIPTNNNTPARSSFHFPPDPALPTSHVTLLDHLQDRLPNHGAGVAMTDSANHHANHHGSSHGNQSPAPTRVDSQDSQVSSDTETVVDSGGGGGRENDAGGGTRSKNSGNQRQNSMTTTLREWDIPFSELRLEGAGPLGSGRFGTVWRGQWHGDVAIKVLHAQDEARTLTQFRQDVETFRKTRHENLVLFMGACTRPPHLAIVTSLCKGQTLHTLVHLRRERFSLARAAAVAQQVSQGMGYLHAKGILHKDLTSKNVFLENQGTKVVITDFGLLTTLQTSQGGARLSVPPGWLCYLAPELVRALSTAPAHAQLPFSRAADVFAFGTVWFELLCGDWPFRGEPPEAVIWQVGAGRKVALTNLHATKDVKDVLMACWAYRAEDREDFAAVIDRLQRLPTAKRLARSPSHPVHLSRSAESVF